MLENMSAEEIGRFNGYEVRDPNGKSLGFVDVVFVDDATGKPEWLGLWDGLPGSRRVIMSVRGVTREDGELRAPYPKEVVERAPTYDDEDDRGLLREDPDGIHISAEKEREAYKLYGVQPLTPAPEGVYIARFRAVVIASAPRR